MNIAKVITTVCLAMITLGGMAQQRMPGRVNTYTDEGPGTGFLKQNLFVGGGLALGFGSYSFDVGVNPEIGYSLNQWLDAGVVVNFNYMSLHDPIYTNQRIHSFNYGGGLFARTYVLPFLFFNVQPEYNWINQNQKDMSTGATYAGNYSATSLLLGAGYGQRMVGQSSFYISLMFDVLGDKNSPYNDSYGHPLPVIRMGFDVYLHKR